MIGLVFGLRPVVAGPVAQRQRPTGPLLLVPAPNLLDQDQIVKDWRSYKIGAGSPLESPTPIRLSPSPDEPRRGRGSYFPNQIWLSVGAEEFVIVFNW
jgi:hypothetical protein